MGVGGALIMPTTLSILVNVFGDPRERAKAIAVWTAASGVGIALGPIVGGRSCAASRGRRCSGSTCRCSLPRSLGTMHLVPDSRDPKPPGSILSERSCRSRAIGSLVYAIIQAPAHGWTSRSTLASFAVGAAFGCAVRRVGVAP